MRDVHQEGRMRRIASEWYSGPLYRFVSTGTIDDDVRSEVWDALRDAEHGGYADEVEMAELESLANYLDGRLNRGPVDGWADVWNPGDA